MGADRAEHRRRLSRANGALSQRWPGADGAINLPGEVRERLLELHEGRPRNGPPGGGALADRPPPGPDGPPRQDGGPPFADQRPEGPGAERPASGTTAAPRGSTSAARRRWAPTGHPGRLSQDDGAYDLTQYVLVLVRMPVVDRQTRPPAPTTLVLATDSLRGGGILFDYRPWLLGGGGSSSSRCCCGCRWCAA